MDRFLCLSVFVLLCTTGYCQQCQPGWTFFPDTESCYAIPTGAEGSWAEAMGYCGAMSGQLATITSRQEQDFVVGLINSTTGLIHDKDFWIGALDILEGGVFMWANELVAVDTAFWGPGQPDNINNEQECARMEQELGYLWGDGTCSSIEYFVCEREAEI